MKIVPILLCSLISFIDLQSQERFLKRAKSALDERDFARASAMVQAYEEKEGTRPESRFMRFRILYESGASILEFEEAWGHLVYSMNSGSLTEKQSREWCDEIGLCESRFNEYMDSCDNRVYWAHARTNDIDTVSLFILNHPKSRNAEFARVLKSRLAFVEAMRRDTERDYTEYLRIYASYPYADSARLLQGNAAYSEAMVTNTVGSFKRFISEYPQSKWVGNARAKLWKLEWDKALQVNTKNGFQSFIAAYPDADQVDDAKARIERYDWNETILDGTLQSYERFSKEHPASIHLAEAEEAIRKIREKQASEEAVEEASALVSSLYFTDAETVLSALTPQAPLEVLKRRDSLLARIRYLRPLLKQTLGRFVCSSNGVEVILLFGVTDSDSSLYCSLKAFSSGVEINGIESDGTFAFSESGGRLDIDWETDEFNKSMSSVTIFMSQNRPALKLANGTVYKKLSTDFESDIESTVKNPVSATIKKQERKTYLTLCGNQYERDVDLESFLAYGWEDRVGFYCLKNYKEGVSSLSISGASNGGIIIKATGELTGKVYTVVYTCDGSLY